MTALVGDDRGGAARKSLFGLLQNATRASFAQPAASVLADALDTRVLPFTLKAAASLSCCMI